MDLYRLCSQIQKLKCWNSGQRHAFLVFLCNTQLVFFTSHREQLADNKHKEWWFQVPYLMPFLILCLIWSTTYKDQAIRDNLCLTENIPPFLSQGIHEDKRNHNISSPGILILAQEITLTKKRNRKKKFCSTTCVFNRTCNRNSLRLSIPEEAPENYLVFAEQLRRTMTCDIFSAVSAAASCKVLHVS